MNLIGMVAVIAVALPLHAETMLVKLDSKAGVRLVGVDIEPVSYKGKAAMRVTHKEGEDGKSVAILPGIDFSSGTIEYEFASSVKPNSPPSYRGFTGLAFRMSADGLKYECVYQRPLNARSQDQEQRNHTVQYISMPDHPWQKLRKETPSRYEAYVDMETGEWTKIRMEIDDEKAHVFINGSAQPVMIVNDMKHGKSHGALALWVDVGTIAHFANLKVTPRN